MLYNKELMDIPHRRSAARHASPTFWQSLMTQCRVIYALIMREIHTRYGRENIGFLWVIGEPILFCAGVAIVWTAIRPSHEHGVQVTAMVVTGYVPLTMWRHTMGRAVKAYEVNSSLLFHQLVTPLDIIMARTILEVVGTILAGVIVLEAAIGFGYMQPPANWFLVYGGMGFITYFCFGFALVVAALTEVSDLLEKAMGIISYLSIPWTGTFFMVDWMPAQYRWILEDTSPMANSIEMIRAGVFGSSVVPHYSVFFLFESCTLLLIVGLYLTKKIRPYIDLT